MNPAYFGVSLYNDTNTGGFITDLLSRLCIEKLVFKESKKVVTDKTLIKDILDLYKVIDKEYIGYLKTFTELGERFPTVRDMLLNNLVESFIDDEDTNFNCYMSPITIYFYDGLLGSLDSVNSLTEYSFSGECNCGHQMMRFLDKISFVEKGFYIGQLWSDYCIVACSDNLNSTTKDISPETVIKFTEYYKQLVKSGRLDPEIHKIGVYSIPWHN